MRNLLSKWIDRDAAVAFAAGAALLLASLANFLGYNNYPYFRPEVGLVVLGMLVLSLSMAAFYVPQRQWGRSFLEGLLAALFADMNTDSAPLIVAAGLGVAGVTAWRRISLLGPMAILGSVVLLTTLAGLGGRSSWIGAVQSEPAGRRSDSRDKPAIVHVLLDEHLGLEGLAYEGADGARLRDELRSLYLASGFAVYGGAYSQHYHSANSVPDMLNYGHGLGLATSRRGVEVGPTKHLGSLVEAGYKLTIFQSDYADVCTGAAFHECVTYDSSSLRPILDVPMGAADRAEVILHKLLKLSDILTWASTRWNITSLIARRVGLSLPEYNTRSGNTSTVGSLESLGDLTNRLRTIRPSEIIFAHLLLPHHPYVVRRDCSYLPWGPWEGLRTAAAPQVKRLAYHEQMRCTSRKIATLLEAISQSPAGSNSVVIIHGDHGSRMGRMGANDQTSMRYDDADLVAVFSTLFAVRAPGFQPAYHDERQPVSALLREFAASGFRSPPHPKPPAVHTVYLADDDWKPKRRVPLPASWTRVRQTGESRGRTFQ